MNERDRFIRATQAARDERAVERQRNSAAVTIQAFTRGFISRKNINDALRLEFDEVFSAFATAADVSHEIPQAVSAFGVIQKLMFIFEEEKDGERFQVLCRYYIKSLQCSDLERSCLLPFSHKEQEVAWKKVMTKVLWQCCCNLPQLKAQVPEECKLLNLYLNILVSFTTTGNWGLLKHKRTGTGELKDLTTKLAASILMKLVGIRLYRKLAETLTNGLCKGRPTLKGTSVTALIHLCLRPLVIGKFQESLLEQFTQEILTIPGLVLYLKDMTGECVALMMSQKVFERTVLLLIQGGGKEGAGAFYDQLDGIPALSLLANVIHLGALEKKVLVENLLDFTNVVTRVLEKCRDDVVGQKSQTKHWHPVLGWYSKPLNRSVEASMQGVVSQLELLWSGDMVKCLFRDLLNLASSTPSPSQNKDFGNHVRVLLKKLKEKQESSSKKMGTQETTVVALVCSLYQSALSTFTQLRFDILSGLCYQDFLLPRLWSFISGMSGAKAFLDRLKTDPRATSPEFQILILFCDAATYLITILDDVELYEKQKPFDPAQLRAMGNLANVMVFRCVWDNLIDIELLPKSGLFQSLHAFLMLLYHRDCRRTFTNEPNFWLVKDAKTSTFLSELEKCNKKAEFLLHKVPHVIPHKERVILFRKYIQNDREGLGLSRDSDQTDGSFTLVTVHRRRLVEDGYRQLSLLPAHTLKAVIRVKFVNEEGLDEAGIDQDGVFKEFLEETIRQVFDPSLNLFKTTSDGRLYPSSTSNIHENHLALFDFVGRMLGKAVYQGILVEVPFASFFLTQVLGKTSGLGYSSIDELSSLDPELAKSLSYIKHYWGDIEELALTFCCNEDYMGELVTHDLVPDGRTVTVNNQNKISYIHHMAHFRMHKQIRDQVVAFVRGFRALIRPEWLALFSVGELQKLISGDSEDLDVADLRKHTQYYGGFHNNHRVINWLWDILQKDFSPEERRLFLKFVTSVSKPPVLGFAHMEPLFSIRCVEVGDDQDQGDTLGSVIRGFLTLSVRRKEPGSRLPTSSTCFNLLKLPNYQKKSTLRDKLKYAIHFSGSTGFELS